MSKNKVLNYSELKKLDSKNYNEKKRIIVNDYIIDIDLHFRPSKISAMFEEIIKANEDFKKENIDFDMNQYTAFLLIKYFTSIGDSLKDVTTMQSALVFKMLYDNDFMNPINEVFDNYCSDEVKKFFNIANETKDNLEKLKTKLKEEFGVDFDKLMDVPNEDGNEADSTKEETSLTSEDEDTITRISDNQENAE